ncbi:MAG TPA: hypothetical protein VNO30_15870 [Kofleriaceae bacterium]|nr:hypothetical protein [Kofleriaceae bacterium]
MQRSCLVIVAAVCAPSPVRAAPAVPSVCSTMVYLTDAKATALHAAGKVKSITPDLEPTFYKIVVAGDKGDRAFMLSVNPVQAMPFKVGDHIDASVRKNRRPHRFFDGQIKGADGKVLIVASESGADDWADGWKVTTGKVVQSEQDQSTKPPAVRRTHALDFARGGTSVTVSPDGCTLVKEGADQYLVSGSGHTSTSVGQRPVGQRPPDGVDHRRFMMVRWSP